VSISITLTYFTAATLRDSRIEDLNSRLRRFGLHPRPPGVSTAADTTKTAAIATLRIGAQLRSQIASAVRRSQADRPGRAANAF
jgi:hypothetical protein